LLLLLLLLLRLDVGLDGISVLLLNAVRRPAIGAPSMGHSAECELPRFGA